MSVNRQGATTAHCALVPGPFLGGRRWYRTPGLWSQVLSREGVPQSGPRTGVPLPQDQDRDTPFPHPGPGQGYPTVPFPFHLARTCHKQDRVRVVRLSCFHAGRLSRLGVIFETRHVLTNPTQNIHRLMLWTKEVNHNSVAMNIAITNLICHQTKHFNFTNCQIHYCSLTKLKNNFGRRCEEKKKNYINSFWNSKYRKEWLCVSKSNFWKRKLPS